MPVAPMAMAATASSNHSSPSGEVVYQDKVIYKQLDNKENRILEEELKNKDNLLRN